MIHLYSDMRKSLLFPSPQRRRTQDEVACGCGVHDLTPTPLLRGEGNIKKRGKNNKMSMEIYFKLQHLVNQIIDFFNVLNIAKMDMVLTVLREGWQRLPHIRQLAERSKSEQPDPKGHAIKTKHWDCSQIILFLNQSSRALGGCHATLAMTGEGNYYVSLQQIIEDE
jgi:hypothetical protein